MLKEEYRQSDKPLFVQWLINIGLAKNQKIANFILVSSFLIFSIIAIYLFAGQYNSSGPGPMNEEEILQLPESVRDITRKHQNVQ